MRGAFLIATLISTAIVMTLNKKQTDAIPKTIHSVLPDENGQGPKNINDVEAHVQKVMNKKMEKRFNNIEQQDE